MTERKRIYCTNCGAWVGENEEKCPYCGMINPTGAEAAHMRRLNAIRDDMAGMEDDIEETYTRELKEKGSLALKIGIGVLIISLLLCLAAFIKLRLEERNTAREMDQEIAFERSFFPELDRIYAEGNDEATLEYIYQLYEREGSSALWSWPHYDYFRHYEDYRGMLHARAMLSGDEDLHEDELGWFVYRILKELENSKNDSLSYENLTAGERETILTWFQEEADFLTNDLKLTEDDITVIREKSLDKNGGFMTYENAEKALKPWISRWVSENR